MPGRVGQGWPVPVEQLARTSCKATLHLPNPKMMPVHRVRSAGGHNHNWRAGWVRMGGLCKPRRLVQQGRGSSCTSCTEMAAKSCGRCQALASSMQELHAACIPAREKGTIIQTRVCAAHKDAGEAAHHCPVAQITGTLLMLEMVA